MNRHGNEELQAEAAGEASPWTPGVIVPFLAVSLIWGCTWIIIRDQLAVVPPSWSVTYRFVLAAAAMFVVAAMRRQPLLLDRKGMAIALAIGITQFMLNFNFVYRAEQFITSGLVAMVFALLMVPNALMARIFLGVRIQPAFVAGSLVAVAGVAMLFAHEFRVAPPGSTEALVLGLGFTLGGVFSASAANVMQAAPSVQRMPVLTLLAWSMAIGALLDAGFALATAGPPVFEARWSYAAGIVWLAVMGSAVAFPLYFGLIRRIGPGRAAYSGVLVPIVAMAFSTALEGYRWSPLAIGGAVLALAGLVIAMQARRPRTPRIAA